MGEAMSTLLFQPPPPSRLRESKLVFLKTSTNEKIPAFHIKIPDAEYTILYSHANAEDLGNVYPWCKFLAKMLKVNLFAYDYTGYGLSKGNPSEDNCYADITAAYKYLINEQNILPNKLILYGRSLGTGPSCYLAATKAEEGVRLAGLILHAPFLSIYRIVIESGCTLMGDRFPNIDYAPLVRCPVLLIHGKRDKIVPFNHSEQLFMAFYEECRTPPLFIPDMGHNHVSASIRGMFLKRVKRFIDDHVATDEYRIPEDELLSISMSTSQDNMNMNKRDRCPSLADTNSTCSDTDDHDELVQKHRPFCVLTCDECDISRVFAADEDNKKIKKQDTFLSNSCVSNSVGCVENNRMSSRSRIRRKKYDTWKKSIFARKNKGVVVPDNIH